MNEVARSKRLTATADEVWVALADFGTIAQWAPNVDHSCLMTTQTTGVGMTRRIQAGRTTLVERVVEWVPASAVAYRIEGLPPVVRSVTNRWSIEPSGADESSNASGDDQNGDDRSSVIVSLTATVDTGPRPPQQLVAKAIGRRLGAANEELLAGLEAKLAASRKAQT